MSRETIPADWRCPGCERRAKPTNHHICPGSLFIFVPKLPLCQKCHAKIHDLIKAEMIRNGSKPLPVEAYFRIWEEFTGEKITYLYEKYKNITRLRTPAEMKKKKKKKTAANQKPKI